mgnify:CR=1 FL=1
MKIDRLIGILSVLLQEDMTTAPELAERFEVSRRTINRDIEALCKAGIPIKTSQGFGGGISIMDGYRMDRTILTSALDRPERSGDQRTCYIADPEGNVIEIGSWNKPYEEKALRIMK